MKECVDIGEKLGYERESLRTFINGLYDEEQNRRVEKTAWEAKHENQIEQLRSQHIM